MQTREELMSVTKELRDALVLRMCDFRISMNGHVDLNTRRLEFARTVVGHHLRLIFSDDAPGKNEWSNTTPGLTLSFEDPLLIDTNQSKGVRLELVFDDEVAGGYFWQPEPTSLCTNTSAEACTWQEGLKKHSSPWRKLLQKEGLAPTKLAPEEATSLILDYLDYRQELLEAALC